MGSVGYDLADAAGRRRGLEQLQRGLPLLETALGVTLPRPALRRWSLSILDDVACADPDIFFGALVDALFDTPFPLAADWMQLVPRIGALLPWPVDLRDASPQLRRLLPAADETLAALARDRYRLEVVDPFPAIDQGDLVYGKINHGFWEFLALVPLEAAGLTPPRPLRVWDMHVASRLPELVAWVIERLRRHHAGRGWPDGTVSVPGAWFGIHFRSGERLAAAELELPLSDVVRGAILGMAHLLGADGPPDAWWFADGSMPKQLFWNGRLDAFLRALADVSDVMVLAGPPNVMSGGVRGWDGPVEHLVLPAGWIEPQWPVVLPVLLGAVDALLDRYRRITVLAQGAEIGGLLPPLIHLVRATDPARRGVVRCIDLGQVLDLAAPDHPGAGGWIHKPIVASHRAKIGPSILQVAMESPPTATRTG